MLPGADWCGSQHLVQCFWHGLVFGSVSGPCDQGADFPEKGLPLHPLPAQVTDWGPSLTQVRDQVLSRSLNASSKALHGAQGDFLPAQDQSPGIGADAISADSGELWGSLPLDSCRMCHLISWFILLRTFWVWSFRGRRRLRRRVLWVKTKFVERSTQRAVWPAAYLAWAWVRGLQQLVGRWSLYLVC